MYKYFAIPHNHTGDINLIFATQYSMYSNYCIIAVISHAIKVMLKILWIRLQQYMNWELPDV